MPKYEPPPVMDLTRCEGCDEVIEPQDPVYCKRDWDQLTAAWRSLGMTEQLTPTELLFAYRMIDAKFANELVLHERTKLRLVKLEAVAEAAEIFMNRVCGCNVLQDPGAICAVCLLKERFTDLSGVRCL